MYREFIILVSVIVVSLFMTVHNRNKEAMQNSETRLSIQRKTQEEMSEVSMHPHAWRLEPRLQSR